MTRFRHVSVREFHLKRAWTGFASAVSLHAHTHHSREAMVDLPSYIIKIPFVPRILERELENFANESGDRIDFFNGWWHPPVTPRQVFDAEARQIEERFGLSPIVSVTDHDEIAANLELQAMYAESRAPISLEWTVPYRCGYFHLGVHNLPRASATEWYERLEGLSAGIPGETLSDLLEDLNADDNVLVVFNHPCWDLAGVGARQHHSAVREFLRRFSKYIHAVEYNGYRCLKENTSARTLAADIGLPIVSGGDRHGCAVNSVLNITSSRSFPEFAREVREGVSHIVVMPEYRRHLTARMIASVADVLRNSRRSASPPQRWTERVSWTSNGRIRRLSLHWPTGGPFLVRSAVSVFQIVASPIVLPFVTAALDRLDPEGAGA
jgi:hypothetical protein